MVLMSNTDPGAGRSRPNIAGGAWRSAMAPTQGVGAGSSAPEGSYEWFFDKAMQNMTPQMNKDIANARASMADSGLLQSTAGQGRLADTRGAYTAAAQQTAMGQAQQASQLGVEAALRAYEMLASQALEKKRLLPDSKYKGPTDPAIFSWLQRYNFLPPGAASGPRGDAISDLSEMMVKPASEQTATPMGRAVAFTEAANRVQAPRPQTGFGESMGMMGEGMEMLGRTLFLMAQGNSFDEAQRKAYRDMNPAPKKATGPKGDAVGGDIWTRRAENVGQTIDMKNLAAQQADAAANRALQRERLSWEQKVYNDQMKQQDDPWEKLFVDINSNLLTDKDNDPSNGIQPPIFPTQIMQNAIGQYGIDVVKEAQSGNPRAIAALKLMYPNGGWQKYLVRIDNNIPMPHGYSANTSGGSVQVGTGPSTVSVPSMGHSSFSNLVSRSNVPAITPQVPSSTYNPFASR